MKKKGFTLIELIVVISIIVLLISISVPAYRSIKIAAKGLAQRCQLKDIEIGLEMWANEHEDEYPDSNIEYGTYSVTGAQKLCEALVGRDLRGFDTKSSWNPNKDEGNANIYPINAANDNPANRLSQYIDLSKINAFQFEQVFNLLIPVM